MTSTKQKLISTARKVKISRFKTYKKLGFIGYRKTVDKLAKISFLLILSLTTLSLFSIQPSDTINAVSDTFETSPQKETQDMVHDDLGDDPVIADTTTQLLQQLEKGVQEKRYTVAEYTLTKGDTLIDLLKQASIPTDEQSQIIDNFTLLINLRSLRPDTTFLIFKNKQDEFAGISLLSQNGETMAVIKDADGNYVPFSQEGRIVIQNIRLSGTIEKNFSESAEKVGIPASLVAQITNALDGEVNFSAFQTGDTFDVIFEQKTTTGGLELGDKQILYVGLNIGKKQIHRYAWTYDGTSSFFNPQGQSDSKELLKRPIKGRPRVSSPYGWRRHPILMARIFHSGVDLAIAQGTPIVAAGDGVITQLGRKGAYGKYIRIKHAQGYQTAYGHMNGYKTGLKVGSKVKRGQVIGYIGRTGRATGPHLHFEVWKNGKTVNPFEKHVLIARQLNGTALEQFQKYAASLHPDFSMHVVGTLAPVPPKKPANLISGR